MSTLGSLLVQNQVVGVTQIEQALQHQVIYGGDLATNLLEMGLVDEDVLAEYAAQSVGLQCLDRWWLDNPERAAIQRVPLEFVNKYAVLPLHEDHGELIFAATALPSEDVLEEFASLVGIGVRPRFILGFRLAMGLNRFFGIPMPVRMRALQSRLVPDFEVDASPFEDSEDQPGELLSLVNDATEPPVENPQEPAPPPQEAEGVKRGRIISVVPDESIIGDKGAIASPADRGDKGESPQVQVSASDQLPAEATAAPGQDRQPTGLGTPSSNARKVGVTTASGMGARAAMTSHPPEIPGMTFGEAITSLESATTRDDILNIVIQYMKRTFEFAVLSVVHGKAAQARTIVEEGSDRPTNNVMFSLDQPGMFRTAFETRSFYLGPPGVTSADKIAIKMLGRNLPRNCTIVPVSLRHRVIVMIYGDNGALGVTSEQLSEAAQLSRKVGDAFEQLLLKQKYGAYRPAPTAAPSAPYLSANRSRPARKRSHMSEWAGLYHMQGDGESGKVKRTPGGTLTGGGLGMNPPQPSGGQAGQKVDEAPSSDYRETLPGQIPSEPPPVANKNSNVHEGPVGHVAPAPQSVGPQNKAQDISTVYFHQLDSVAPAASPAVDDQVSPRPSRPLPLYEERETNAIGISPPSERQIPEPAHVVIESERDYNSKSNGIARPVVYVGSENIKDDSTQRVTHRLSPAAAFGKQEAASQHERQSVVRRVEAIKVGGYQRVGDPIVQTGNKPRSVVVDMHEEIDRLVQRILSTGPFDDVSANLLLGIGDDAMAELIKHFPGPLWYDRYQEKGRLRRVGHHGPLLKTLLMFEHRAVPFILPMFEKLDSDVRFYATFLFSELSYPEALGPLTTRLFDNDRQIRALAVDVIRGFSQFSEFKWAIREVIAVLGRSNASLEARRIAAEALGELRDRSSVSALIDMLESVDGVLVERSHRALVKICFNDFGFAGQKWRNWWTGRQKQNRIEWAIEGIEHTKETIRIAAFDELKKIVGEAIAVPQTLADGKQRHEFKRQCLEWWKSEGYALYSSQESS